MLQSTTRLKTHLQQDPQDKFLRIALTLLLSLALILHIYLVQPPQPFHHEVVGVERSIEKERVYQHRWVLQGGGGGGGVSVEENEGGKVGGMKGGSRVMSGGGSVNVEVEVGGGRDMEIGGGKGMGMRRNGVRRNGVRRNGVRFVRGFMMKGNVVKSGIEEDIECGVGVGDEEEEEVKGMVGGRVVRLSGAGHLRGDCGYYGGLLGGSVREYYGGIKGVGEGVGRRKGFWEWEVYGRDLMGEGVGMGDKGLVEKGLEVVRGIVGKKGDRESKVGLLELEVVGRGVVLLRSLGICEGVVGGLGGWLEREGDKVGGKGAGRKGRGDGWVLAVRALVGGIQGNVGSGEEKRNEGEKMARKLVERLVMLQGKEGNGWMYYFKKKDRGVERDARLEGLYRHGLAALYLTRLYAVTRTYSMHRLLATSLRKALDVKHLESSLENAVDGADEDKKRSLHMMYVEVLMKAGEMLRDGHMMGFGKELAEWHLNVSFTERKGVQAFRETPWKRCENIPAPPPIRLR